MGQEGARDGGKWVGRCNVEKERTGGQVFPVGPIGKGGGQSKPIPHVLMWKRARVIYTLPLLLSVVHRSALGKGSTAINRASLYPFMLCFDGGSQP